MEINLFSPLKAGALTLKNRIVMAPLTRARAGESRLPNDLMMEYYTQRASAGLIISEATAISKQGYGWMNAPALYDDAQQEGWKKITDAVHSAGGLMALQLWHMGRLSHPAFLDGKLPEAPSAIAPPGVARSLEGKIPYVTPHAMSKDDIKRAVDDFAIGARRAIDAGFAAVEIHGANGYLIDEFLRDSTNHRTDEYGGSLENRTQFLREVVQAVVAEIGADRTGIRFSPFNNPGQGSIDSNIEETFTAAAKAIQPFNLAFLELNDPSIDEKGNHKAAHMTSVIRKIHKGVLIANNGYTSETGNALIKSGGADAVAWGKWFISNPDLVERFKTGAPLNDLDMTSLYKGTTKGYTDYPTLEQLKKTA